MTRRSTRITQPSITSKNKISSISNTMHTRSITRMRRHSRRNIRSSSKHTRIRNTMNTSSIRSVSIKFRLSSHIHSKTRIRIRPRQYSASSTSRSTSISKTRITRIHKISSIRNTMHTSRKTSMSIQLGLSSNTKREIRLKNTTSKIQLRITNSSTSRNLSISNRTIRRSTSITKTSINRIHKIRSISNTMHTSRRTSMSIQLCLSSRIKSKIRNKNTTSKIKFRITNSRSRINHTINNTIRRQSTNSNIIRR